MLDSISISNLNVHLLFSLRLSNDLDIEAAYETQRLKLLRLLAGLLYIVAFVSVLPVASVMPVRVRAYVASVLDRAEAAADCLVIVAASLLFGYRMPPENDLPMPLNAECLDERDVSAEHLLQRIAALRAVLKNLPRYAKRLVQRCAELWEERACEFVAVIQCGLEDTLRAGQFLLPRVERPPDKRFRAFG